MVLEYGIYFQTPIKKDISMGEFKKVIKSWFDRAQVDFLDSLLGFNVKDRSIYRLLCFLTLPMS